MRPFTRLAPVMMIAGAAVLCTGSGFAASAPAASEFYPLVGSWHGRGEMADPGQPPAKLALSLYCSKVSSGWAVRCAMQAKNKQMDITESDLMGVDPVTGQAHWYAVTNQGETHDHLAAWPDPHTMRAHYAWTQDGKHMAEEITFKLAGKRHMTFRSVVSADGKEAGVFSGALERK